jgi:uncharacterized protein YndB with AHSA1/START domain
MPTARASRTIAASAEQLWEIVRDPHHLPRWWPRVTRVEDVSGAAFTEVMTTSRGKVVRADFSVVRTDEQERALTWAQQLEGTPFARVLKSAETEVRLEPVQLDSRASAATEELRAGVATYVSIELRQALTGFFPRFGGYMVRRAAAATINEALDGLERIGV